MSQTISQTLLDLASEFSSLRQAGIKNRFPKDLWQKAVTIAQQLPLYDVCQAIKVQPAYFKKKMAAFSSDESVTFLELPSLSSNPLKITIESPTCYKFTIEGASSSHLPALLTQFMKEGVTCCN